MDSSWLAVRHRCAGQAVCEIAIRVEGPWRRSSELPKTPQTIGANASLAASSCPRDLAPMPLPGSVLSQPSVAFGPSRQRLDQLLSGVTNPSLKFCELIRNFGCTMFAV